MHESYRMKTIDEWGGDYTATDIVKEMVVL